MFVRKYMFIESECYIKFLDSHRYIKRLLIVLCPFILPTVPRDKKIAMLYRKVRSSLLESREMEPASTDISIATPSLLNGTGTPIFITKS